MSEDVFSNYDDEARFRMGEGVISNSAGRKKPNIFDDMDSTDGAEMFMDQLRETSSAFPDPPSIDHPPAPPIHASASGGFDPAAFLEPSTVSSSAHSARSRGEAKDSSGLENIGTGAGMDAGMDADFQQMMSDPAAMDAMMGGLSQEERAEFSQLLGQFGLSGDLDGIGEELVGGAVQSPQEGADVGGVDVEARPLPADPKMEDLFSGADPDDPQAFDELMQQLSRIETESEGKVGLDKLMQQFMMSEAAANEGDEGERDGQEDRGEEEVPEASFRDKVEPAPAPVQPAREVSEPYSSSRRIPEDIFQVFSAPPTTHSEESPELSHNPNSESPSLLAELLDGGSSDLSGQTQLPADTFETGLVPDQRVFSQKAINSEWDMIEFGRVPNTDYSQVPVLQRRLENVEKAEAAYRYMQENEEGCAVTVEVLNSLLSCYTEALMAAGAKSVMEEEFNKHALAPNDLSYQHLVRMSLRKKDLDGTLEIMETMKSLGVAPTPDTWGLVIDAFAARNKPVEALKVIDELASTHPATIKEIPDGYLKRTRMLCRKLAVEHPQLPSDPEQWVRDVKLNRRRMKLASKSEIQPLRSLLYT